MKSTDKLKAIKMGQITSASTSLKTDIVALQEKILSMNKAVFVSYDTLVQSIQDLNNVTKSFTDRSGKQLRFSIKKGTDKGILWKTFIRIRCLKVNTATNSIESSRLLKLHQYLVMCSEILERFKMISGTPKFGEATGVRNADETDPLPSTSQNKEFMVSAYFTNKDGLGSAELSEDLNECCVCMDSKACIMLSCNHEFCESCIDNWIRDKSHSNCPLCRQRVHNADDTWVLTEKGNANDYETEVKGYLVGLADRKK